MKVQSTVCNECHDLLMVSVVFNDIAILNIQSIDYSCIINEIGKIEAVNLLQNADLSEVSGVSQK